MVLEQVATLDRERVDIGPAHQDDHHGQEQNDHQAGSARRPCHQPPADTGAARGKRRASSESVAPMPHRWLMVRGVGSATATSPSPAGERRSRVGVRPQPPRAHRGPERGERREVDTSRGPVSVVDTGDVVLLARHGTDSFVPAAPHRPPPQHGGLLWPAAVLRHRGSSPPRSTGSLRRDRPPGTPGAGPD
ncbi:MAG: hypothetical protein U5R31_03355 [Acidimicrobiia bacterium]|nr:hypothetical protein [Acidimicrobiia bacterium]